MNHSLRFSCGAVGPPNSRRKITLPAYSAESVGLMRATYRVRLLTRVRAAADLGFDLQRPSEAWRAQKWSVPKNGGATNQVDVA